MLHSLPSVMVVSLWVIYYRVCVYVCVCQWCNSIPCSVYYPNLDISSQQVSSLAWLCMNIRTYVPMYTFVRLTDVVMSSSSSIAHAQRLLWFSAVIVITMPSNSVVYCTVNEIHWTIFSKFEMLIGWQCVGTWACYVQSLACVSANSPWFLSICPSAYKVLHSCNSYNIA